jgi:hypothetical protein
MAQKKYSVYNNESIEGDQQLAVELCSNYVALVLGTSSKIAGFEYYDSEDNDLQDVFEHIKHNSQLLDTNYSEARVYYNLPESVLVPVGQFNTSVASECVDLAFGPATAARINVENVNVQPGIVNVYRSNEDWQQLINNYFRAVTKRHLISKLIEKAPAEGLKVQFYKEQMIVIAKRDQQLQLARGFAFTTDEDAVYHLLNVCKQTAIDPAEATIEISGLVENDSKALQLIRKYFFTVRLEHPAKSILPQQELSKYPLHYFTPFFNLLS